MPSSHWLGHTTEFATSAGGVLAFVNVWDGVVRGGVSPWPPPELTQKLYKSRQERAFIGPSLDRAKATLGFYSDLQSVHSEDAVTWSLFGPLAYSAPSVRVAFVQELFQLLGITSDVSAATIWLAPYPPP